MAGDVVGRELELATIERALDTIPHGPTAVLLSGDAGIGKTTVWRRGLRSESALGSERIDPCDIL